MSKKGGRKQQTLAEAARHNLREIQVENGAIYGKIDQTRSHLNEVLIGPRTSIEVEEAATKLFLEIGIDPSSLRKDYHQASEHVFSLPHGLNDSDFFTTVADCAKSIFGADKVLSFVIHRDQAQPHAHMLVSPISETQYQGCKLVTPNALKLLKEKFRQAAEIIGFEPTSNGKVKRQKMQDQAAVVISYLEYTHHPMLSDATWPAILEMINHNPRPLFDRFRLDAVSIPKQASQERLIQTGNLPVKTIGFETPRGTDQNLSCVGINSSTRSRIPPPNSAQETDEEAAIIRVKECDLKPEEFDFETGEFRKL